jgi:hypothetical protein
MAEGKHKDCQLEGNFLVNVNNAKAFWYFLQ